MPGAHNGLEFIVGELSGAVNALVKEVKDGNDRMVEAIERQAEAMEEHKKDDALVYRAVADLSEWKNGVNGENGAKKTLDGMERQRTKFLSFVAGMAFIGGVAGHKVTEVVSVVIELLGKHG